MGVGVGYLIFIISHEQHCGRQTHHDSVDPQRGAAILSRKCFILIRSQLWLDCIQHLSKQNTCPHDSPFFGGPHLTGDKNGISPQAELRLPHYLKVTITRTDKLRNRGTCKDKIHFDVFVVNARVAAKESDKETVWVQFVQINKGEMNHIPARTIHAQWLTRCQALKIHLIAQGKKMLIKLSH